MNHVTLRHLVSAPHAKALESTGLLDRQTCDPLFNERIARLHAQITAALALRSLLEELGFPLPDALDLAPLVEMAYESKLLSYKQAGILLRINREANEAKHLINFSSRL